MAFPIKKPPNAWSEEDLQLLKSDCIPEGLRLDYKRELPLEPKSKRFDLLKDITSMANASGGFIIYGIEEEHHPELGSVPKSLVPITEPDLNDKANRIIRAAVAPAVEFHLFPVRAATGGYYIVAYIPESRFKPHAFTWKGKVEYYIRRNQDNFPLTEPELRDMYSRSTQMQQFLEQRYNELDLNIGTGAICSLVSIPTISGIKILDTLSVPKSELLSDAYINMFGSCDGPQPLVDRFEEIKRSSAYVRGVRLFQDGSFAILEGVPEIAILSGTEILLWLDSFYTHWYKGLKYLNSVYVKQKYYGPLRLYLETTGFDHPNITIGFVSARPKFSLKHFRMSFDCTTEELEEPSKLCSSMAKYFLQACNIDVSQSNFDAWLAKVDK